MSKHAANYLHFSGTKPCKRSCQMAKPSFNVKFLKEHVKVLGPFVTGNYYFWTLFETNGTA